MVATAAAPPPGMRVVYARSFTPRQRDRCISSEPSSVNVIMPSTSDGSMPASSSAALLHSAASVSSERPEDFENSVWPMPAMAASRKLRGMTVAAMGRPYGLEHRHLPPADGLVEEHLDRQPRRDLLECDAVEVRDQPEAFLEVDQRHDRRLVEAHRL